MLRINWIQSFLQSETDGGITTHSDLEEDPDNSAAEDHTPEAAASPADTAEEALPDNHPAGKHTDRTADTVRTRARTPAAGESREEAGRASRNPGDTAEEACSDRWVPCWDPPADRAASAARLRRPSAAEAGRRARP